MAEITGVKKATIIALARAFAGAKRPVALCGRGRGTTPGSLKEFAAVHALNALVGALNRPGGIWAVPLPEYIDWPEVEMDQTAANGMQAERLDGTDSGKPSAKYLLDRLPKAVTSEAGYPLEALLISEANPMYTMPNTAGTAAAFEKIPFVVSFTPYLHETAENADLILPIHAHLERYEDVPTPLGFTRPFIGLAKPVVPPQYNTRHMGDVIIHMAQTLGGAVGDAFAWDNYAECIEETLDTTWETLDETGYWVDEQFEPAQEFETDSGRFEFTNARMAGLPDYAPTPPEGEASSYPLILIPYDSMRLSNREIADPPFMLKAVPDTVLKDRHVFVEINPDTAAALKLSEGKAAKLTTPLNTAVVKIHLSAGIKPNIVAMPTGLGHKGNDAYVDDKGVNFNAFIGPVEDPASGLNAAWGIRARLEKA